MITAFFGPERLSATRPIVAGTCLAALRLRSLRSAMRHGWSGESASVPKPLTRLVTRPQKISRPADPGPDAGLAAPRDPTRSTEIRLLQLVQNPFQRGLLVQPARVHRMSILAFCYSRPKLESYSDKRKASEPQTGFSPTVRETARHPMAVA